MAYERKFEKVDLADTIIKVDFTERERAWDAAIQHVKMGIAVTPIMVHQPTYNDDKKPVTQYGDEHIMHGAYTTESGRDGQFYMVMVDRDNSGDWKALTPCSDYYAAVEPAEIYKNLRKMLNGSANQPTLVYNAFNGGSQLLRVRIDDIEGVNIESANGLHMELFLRTSIDKTSNHSMSVMPVTSDGTPLLFNDTGKAGFNFKVRHTNKARTEIVNFNAAVASIVESWNSTIVPYVNFLSDGDFSEAETMALLTNIAEDAKLPKDLTEEIVGACKSEVKGGGRGTGITIIKRFSEAVANRDVTPMARQRDEDKVGKAITSRVRQLFQKRQNSLV